MPQWYIDAINSMWANYKKAVAEIVQQAVKNQIKKIMDNEDFSLSLQHKIATIVGNDSYLFKSKLIIKLIIDELIKEDKVSSPVDKMVIQSIKKHCE